MNSLVLRTATRILKPLMLLFSVYLLLIGHNEPGGGFTGGLVAATAFCLQALAFTPEAARATLRVRPAAMVSAGLLVALASGLLGAAAGDPFLTGVWTTAPLPLVGAVKVGTPLLFDLGVYLVVIGFTTMIVIGLMEANRED